MKYLVENLIVLLLTCLILCLSACGNETESINTNHPPRLI